MGTTKPDTTSTKASAKRRLPVLKSEAAPDDGEARPPWQWVGFGTVMMFAVWLPFAYLGEAVLVRVRSDGGALLPAMAAIVPLVIAALSGGFLVGRFGGAAGAREGLLAGIATGAVAVLFTTVASGFSPFFLVVIAMTGLLAGAGGVVGVRQRVR